MANAQIITTVAGNGTQGYSGDGGQATNAELNYPGGVYFDVVGNMFITENLGNRIRKVNTLGIITTVAGNGFGAGTPSCTPCYAGDGGQATAAKLNSPTQVAIDVAGNLFIADGYNYCIRKVNTAGIISTIAGTGNAGYSGDGGQATAAEIYYSTGIAFDTFGNLYINNGDLIRMINTAGIINTIAGNGVVGYSGDGGQATNAELDGVEGLAFDYAGNLYIADQGNNRVRMINTVGIISTFAGNGVAGYYGDGGQATSAEFDEVEGVSCDISGNLYISDGARVRIVNTAGFIITIAGNGVGGYGGDGGQATAAELDITGQVAFDAAGNMYIADAGNNCIRKVTNIGQAAGIEQFANNNEQVTVYPNPASTSLTLTLSPAVGGTGKGEEPATLQITDMLGNMIKQAVIYNLTSTIDISDLSEGVYNISITSKEGVANKKVVIVR
jgi:hypothetical protein